MDNIEKLAILGVVFAALIFGNLIFTDTCFDKSSYLPDDDGYMNFEDTLFVDNGVTKEVEECWDKKKQRRLIDYV